MNLTNTNDLLKRAEKVVPSLSQTFSKGPNQWARGTSPSYLQKGEGAWVWDVDGNKFLDHLMALGPIILGYNNPAVNKAITDQLEEGIIFSQMHPLEVEVSELLCDLIPCAEMVRFGKTGSDATAAAVRVSRAFTGRDHIAVCGYHGWHDWYIGTTLRSLGVPKAMQDLSHSFNYNDIDSLKQLVKQHPGEIAAIVMEPIGIVEPENNFLEEVREIADRENIVLVFDEIVTGFRLDLSGAQNHFNVRPDLACFGKAMANGMPLSAVVGKAEIMHSFDDIFFSGTFGGELLSLAACKATVGEIRKHDVIEHITDYGARLRRGIEQLISEHNLTSAIEVVGQNVRSVLTFPDVDEKEMRVRRTYFMQECVKRGLLYYCAQLPCLAHGEEELQFTLNVFQEVMPKFAEAVRSNNVENLLEGPCVDAIFRKP